MALSTYQSTLVRTDVEQRASKYITGVYVWMAVGVATSALVGLGLSASGLMIPLLQNLGSAFMWLVFILQFGSVMVFSGAAARMNTSACRAAYLFYSVITGLTVALVTYIYTMASIAGVFALATMAFAGLALFGAITKKNLGPIGTFCTMGLFMTFGLGIIYMIGATFAPAAQWLQTLNLTIGALGILVFSGLTAWESQKLREQAYELARTDASTLHINSYVVRGAFTMYLNFINLFFSLLRLFGSRR